MRRLPHSLLLSFSLLMILSVLVAPHLVRPWYSEGHRIVASKAIKALPTKLQGFFTYYWYVINASANYPDQYWQDYDSNEGPKHYIDLEVAGKNYENKEAGVLPYAINETYYNMVQYWKAGDYGMALIHAGALCHYVADSCQPYHTTVNYNPKGKHGLADSLLELHLGELTLVQPTSLARVSNVFNESLQIIWRSYEYLSRLNATLIGNPDDPKDDQDWNSELKDMVQERANAAINFTARLWFSAVEAAGGTVPDVPSSNALRIAASAPTEVFDNKSVRVRIVVEDSLGVPAQATVSANFGSTSLNVVSAPDKNPMGKYEALILVPTLADNTGKQVELSISTSFSDRTPASWKGPILVKASKPPTVETTSDFVALGGIALVAVVVVALSALKYVRRR